MRGVGRYYERWGCRYEGWIKGMRGGVGCGGVGVGVLVVTLSPWKW